MALPWLQGSAWREVLQGLCGLSLLAPLQLSTHGCSPGIVPLFESHVGRCLKLGGWLFLAAVSVLPSRWDLPLFQGDGLLLYSFITGDRQTPLLP